MVKLTKVRYADDRVTIGYQQEGDGLHATAEVVGEEAPPPEFEGALKALVPFVPKICAPVLNPGEFKKNAIVTGISISYKNDRPIYVIKAKISVTGANGPLNIATPPLLEPEEDSGEMAYRADLFKALREFVRQAELYLEGQRAQGDLFPGREDQQNGRRPGGSKKGSRKEEDQLAAKRREKEIDRAVLDIIRLDLVENAQADLEFIGARVLDRFDGYAYKDDRGKEWPGAHRHVTEDNRVVWCGLSTTGGVARFWYDIQVDAWDPSVSAATVQGDVLAARALRAFMMRAPSDETAAPAAEPEATNEPAAEPAKS